jgi:thymidylate kinase
MFVAIEGIDGAGKTTVCRILHETVPNVEIIRTPGARLPGVRDLVLSKDYGLSPKCRLMFFLGEMMDVYDNIIKHQGKDKIAITDRFFLSTYIYQVITNAERFSVDEYATILNIFNFMLPSLDYTFVLDANIETAVERSKDHNESGKKDFFEDSAFEDWKRRKSYYDTAEQLEIAQSLGKVIHIDTNLNDAESVASIIRGALHVR